MTWHPPIPIPIPDSSSGSDTKFDPDLGANDSSIDKIDYVPARPEIEIPMRAEMVRLTLFLLDLKLILWRMKMMRSIF
jgi:hypothetical protein